MNKTLKIFSILAVVAMSLVACTPDNGEEEQVKGEKPVADFEYAIDGMTVVFTNKTTGADSYSWDFGDGEKSTAVCPVHTYASADTYKVKLTAKNSAGTNKKEVEITLAGAVKAYFSYAAQTDRAGLFGRVISFDATGSSNAETIAWDFGDGETATEFKVDHVYADFGTYTVKATVSNASGSDTYSAKVDVIAYGELLKGGSMEEDDAQYWTYWSSDVFPEDNYDTPSEGVSSWVPTWGYTEDGPKNGNGGCLRLSSENQIHDQANNCRFWQAIEVVEGDYLVLSAQMKWGENTNDCGLLWFGIADSEDKIGVDGTSVVEMFNYWSAAGTAPVPPLDGGFEADENYIAANVALGLGYSNGGRAEAGYWAQKTGTVYFYVDYRSVWGPFFGPGINIYFDELSVRIGVPPAEE